MTSGIVRMRSHVRRIGTLSGMELPVDFFGELAADALHLRQILDARADDSLQPAEAREQLFAALRSDSRDALERRRGASLGASRPVSGDGKAVRFVSDPLDQMQPGAVGGKRHPTLADPQLFESGLPFRALGNAHERKVGQTDLPERSLPRIPLSLAAVAAHQP